jgi:ATP-dependent protease HslVU (ClpYQ) peptidase subunit
MTCIVGIIDNESVYIGADRAASDGSSILSIKNPKVELRNGWIYAYAGTIGIGQLLSYIPLPAEVDEIFPYIRLTIVEELKKAIESFSYIPTENDTTWLIGKNGRLFELSSSDWGVIEINESAIGGGSQYAFGSLYTSIDKDPIERVGLALGAAITYSPDCQGPVDILFV